jgi:putative integral membrane protein (TIGR02587 family)
MADEHRGPPSPTDRTGSLERRSADRRFAVGVARAFGGALIFALPLLMTMEMWSLGFSMERLRLALLITLMLPLLVGLSHFSGFEETFRLEQAVLDALVACAVATAASACCLGLFGVLASGTSLNEAVGMIALQAVPGSIGALLARSQLGDERAREDEQRKRRQAGSAGEHFFMAIGALFLAANVAPTEEMVLIAYQMTAWHQALLAAASLVLMHAFVYALGFRGQELPPPRQPAWRVFLHFTVLGYALALAISAYMLWTFGRFDGLPWAERVKVTVVLGFPAALGAASARLIL